MSQEEFALLEQRFTERGTLWWDATNPLHEIVANGGRIVACRFENGGGCGTGALIRGGVRLELSPGVAGGYLIYPEDGGPPRIIGDKTLWTEAERLSLGVDHATLEIIPIDQTSSDLVA